MRPTEILMAEHRVIEQVLACVQRMADACERSGRLDPEPARDAIAFFRTFADRCHHGKEEEQLFPAMESRGYSPQAGPTAVMRMEHEEGRSLIGRMERSVSGAAEDVPAEVRAFVDAARAYVLLLSQHIEKEDHCLFPMAEQAIGPEQQAELLERFRRVDREEIGEAEHRKCLETADRLAERYGVTRAGV